MLKNKTGQRFDPNPFDGLVLYTGIKPKVPPFKQRRAGTRHFKIIKCPGHPPGSVTLVQTDCGDDSFNRHLSGYGVDRAVTLSLDSLATNWTPD
jgi:glyoxylase-like metal-dependent hydrolase (beta-lactamase superfamily II)